MPGYKTPPETKQEILAKIKQGQQVSDLASAYGISPRTIYKWLQKQADGPGGSNHEVGKLRRERDALLKLVGELTLKLSKGKKKRGGKQHG